MVEQRFHMYFTLRLLILLPLVQTAISAQLQTTTPPPRAKAPPWELFRPTFYDRKMTEAQKKILSPSPENQTRFATFLREANTGLFRLLPKGEYEFSDAFQGFEANGFAYGSVVTTTRGVTYAVRSISYEKDGYLVYPNDPYTRFEMSRLGYDGSDILIAFRIVGRNEDGSLEILWKRLRRYQNPKIKGEQIHSLESLKLSIERELSPGSRLTAVIAFLDLNGIEHSDYVEGYHDENAVSGTAGLVNATIPRIERRSRATFDLQLQFYFTDRKELISYAMKKVRH